MAFSPGAAMMSPADLGRRRITLRARGSGAGFTVMGFSQTSGQMPVIEPFPVGADWREIRVPFSALEGFDPNTATMLLIGAVEPGEYRLELADIRLVAE